MTEGRRIPKMSFDDLEAMPKDLGVVTGIYGKNGRVFASTSSGVEYMLPDRGTVDLNDGTWERINSDLIGHEPRREKIAAEDLPAKDAS